MMVSPAWSLGRDLNPRPPAYEADALPAEPPRLPNELREAHIFKTFGRNSLTEATQA